MCVVGVKVIVLIDDLFFFGIIMCCEYDMFVVVYGWDVEVFVEIN